MGAKVTRMSDSDSCDFSRMASDAWACSRDGNERDGEEGPAGD